MKHTYTKMLFILVFLCSGWAVQAQEICDNGIDDNNNGLIDLQDPECACHPIIQLLAPNSLPNPSFEEMDCCPSNFSQLQCTRDWKLGNTATADYMHTCGFILAGITNSGLVPFPDGDGVAGMIFADGWKEYLSICLNDTIPCGAEVTISFWTAFVPIQNNGQLCTIISKLGPVQFTIYGAPHCNSLTLDVTDCPSKGDLTWMAMGSVMINPLNEWHQVSLTFTTPEEITAIMLGAPCQLSGEFTGPLCYPYYVIDGIVVKEEITMNKIPIREKGQMCQVADTLEAAIPCNDAGLWQWYYEGVALAGETSSLLSLSEYDYALGDYQVLYTTSEGCASGNFLVQIRDLDTTISRIGNTLVAQETNVTYKWVDCDNGYKLIAGEASPAFTPTKNGNYAVILTHTNCADTSSCYAIMTVGVNESVLPHLRVYPNPTPGALTIEFGQIIAHANLEIIDLFGRITATQKIRDADKMALTLEGMPGIYWVRLYSEGEMLAVIRVLKE